MQLLFLCYLPNCCKDFTFTTARCSLQLTQQILTFRARRSLRMANFVDCGCWFANEFFCKIAACGPLIYWWYYWKMFAVNFYASCFDSRGNSIGEKLIRFDWEKAIYQPLFMLANTLQTILQSKWPQLKKGNNLTTISTRRCKEEYYKSFFQNNKKDSKKYEKV